jgi:hypothetical protein
MVQRYHAHGLRDSDLFLRRIGSIGLDAGRLTPDQLEILAELSEHCPGCEDPARCRADLAAAPMAREWDDWDEYCPNAPKLRILAALTMFCDDTAPQAK